MSALFSIHLAYRDERFAMPYDAIQECLDDTALAKLIEDGGTCEIWIGELRLTGKPITTRQELKQAIVGNSQTILRGVL